MRDEDQLREIEAVIAGAPLLELRRHARFTDAELEASLADADAAVLPYSFGTHSGWVELCWDLGVPIVTARVGHLAEQHPDDAHVYEPEDGDGLVGAIESALTGATASGSRERAELVGRRRRERSLQSIIIAGQHERLYRELIA